MKKMFTLIALVFLVVFTGVNAQVSSTKLGILRNVCAINGAPNSFYAVGENGTLLKSADIGNTWSQMKSPTYQELGQICFPTPTIGYMTENNSAYIYKTTNGGNSWQYIKYLGSQQISKMRFIDKDTGYVLMYDQIYKTKDGGTNWNQIYSSSNNTFNDIFFVTPSTGYTVSNNKKIFKTVDYGKSWIPILVDTIPISGHLRSIFFTSLSIGYIVSGEGNVLKTINGGANWTYQFLPHPIDKIEFFNPSNGCITAGKYFYKGDGTTWTLDSIKGAQSIYSIALESGSTKGVMVGMSGLIANTTNGIIWNTKNAGLNSIRSIAFISPTIGFMAGDNLTILKTTDGGNSFQANYSGNEFLNFEKIEFIDASTGFAYADNNYVYRTTDGGDTWLKTALGQTMTDISFANSSVGLGSTYSGIYMSTNGGNSFNYRSGEILRKIESLPGSPNIALGIDNTNNLIRKTTDTGATFSTVFNSTAYLTDIFALNTSIVFVCG